MGLNAADRVGVYEVTGAIGVGGMGEVYRARDTRLKRDVALKILPESFSTDADRLARFQREAEVLASLNHPNVAAIYGLEESGGIRALVMELVEGQTLADRIAQGPIPVDEALPIAKQIAEALEAAHEQGIIHRDLKPANIKVRPDGTVKVLDFGLAKALEPANGVSPSTSQSPTITSPAMMTGVGMLLGTAAYMSPEQARGKPVDKRTDIWAFGCVLFEMLTGRRAFDGEDVSVVLASIIKSDPSWDGLPVDAPYGIRSVLRGCLQKNPRDRIRDIGDVRLTLAGAFDVPPLQLASGPTVPRGRRVTLAIVASALTAALASAFAVWWSLRPLPDPIDRLTISHPEPEVVGGNNVDVAITPDGRQVVYLASQGGQGRMYLRPLNALSAISLGGSDNVRDVFISPDGEWVGFYDTSDRTLKRVSVRGGPPLAISRIPEGIVLQGATWASDDTVIFGSSNLNGGLFRVSTRGGSPEPLTKPDAQKGEHSHRLPAILPGGQAVAFTIHPADNQLENARIGLLDFRSGNQKILIQGGSHARYVRTGHLVYASVGTLRAVAFDVRRLEVRGNAVAVVERVVTKPGGSASFSIADTGTLTYIAGETSTKRTLVWVDRQGHEQPINVPPRAYAYARLSPDGTQVALDVREDLNDVWIWDFVRQTLTRLTRDPGLNRGPIWTPDGRHVVFSVGSDAGEPIFWHRADGSGSSERLTQVSGRSDTHGPESFSPDGTRLVFTHSRSGGAPPYNIGVMTLTGDRKVEMLLNEDYSEANAVISPDGKWLAYQSNESGRDEIYVRPFPDVNTGRWQVSTEGGTRPVWARNGRELFYYLPPGVVMSATVSADTGFASSVPRAVLKGNYLSPNAGRMYDVSPDGQRFLMMKDAELKDGATAAPQLVVVQNWFQELERLVPVN